MSYLSHWKFSDEGCRSQSSFCHAWPYISMISFGINNIPILNIHGIDYCSNIFGVSKCEGIWILENYALHDNSSL